MDIERSIFQDLVKWKNSPFRKPLILRGVRQCGKTWILKEFGRREFEDVVYLNFEKDSNLASFFDGAYDPTIILTNLSAYARKTIVPGKTLLIFDEIQTCPRALNSLKYFCEESPEIVIASAGSLLGLSLASPEGFPVGKVDFLQLYPCTFKEYLHTVDPMLGDYVQNVQLQPIPKAFTERLEDYLREYLAFGGMPAVVSAFLQSHDIERAEQELEAILVAYESDFSKHVPIKDVPKLYLLWNAIPRQFAKENDKFIYGEVRTGARAKDFEDALQWLSNASMVHYVHQVETPEQPLRANENRKNFKLYVADVGVLRRLAGLAPSLLLNKQDIFADFKGHLVENFVLQQLCAMKFSPVCYWTNSGGRAEVDFLIQHDDAVIPIETKSGLNLKAQSLKLYREKYRPPLAVRTSMQNLRLDNGLLNIPLYLLGELPRLIRLVKE